MGFNSAEKKVYGFTEILQNFDEVLPGQKETFFTKNNCQIFSSNSLDLCLYDSPNKPWKKLVRGWTTALMLDFEGKLKNLGTPYSLKSNKNIDQNTFVEVDLSFLQNDEMINDIFAQSESYAILTNLGRLYAMGWNEHGNLGMGSTENQNNFVYVADGV